MTHEDLEQIRQIIREELTTLKFVPLLTYPPPCSHEWITNYFGTLPQTTCKRCGEFFNYRLSKPE